MTIAGRVIAASWAFCAVGLSTLTGCGQLGLGGGSDGSGEGKVAHAEQGPDKAGSQPPPQPPKPQDPNDHQPPPGAPGPSEQPPAAPPASSAPAKAPGEPPAAPEAPAKPVPSHPPAHSVDLSEGGTGEVASSYGFPEPATDMSEPPVCAVHARVFTWPAGPGGHQAIINLTLSNLGGGQIDVPWDLRLETLGAIKLVRAWSLSDALLEDGVLFGQGISSGQELEGGGLSSVDVGVVLALEGEDLALGGAVINDHPCHLVVE